MTSRRTAVVTGASSGIGEATARRLAVEGFDVVVAARRRDRLDAIAAEIGAIAYTLDVTLPDSVEAFAGALTTCDVLVNNAGGARGLTPVGESDDEQWRWMYETNVIGMMRVTKALLPLIIGGGNGHIVLLGSIAGREVYEGGAGYAAAKHAARAVNETLRLELLGKPVRITEVAPGMVETDFSLLRFAGDAERAAKTYEGLTPLTADDIADCVAFAVTRPPHVDIDVMVVKSRDQASATRAFRR
jgi:NADP-dependent 3-hydroxy acid dehydrogenase YdfG